MSETLTAFFEMGGYARFIWPAYGLVFLVTLGLVIASVRTMKSREKTLARLQSELPSRRGRLS